MNYGFPGYFVSLRIQSECEKIRTRKTPNTDAFHTVEAFCFANLKRDSNIDVTKRTDPKSSDSELYSQPS